eukprot:UN03958
MVIITHNFIRGRTHPHPSPTKQKKIAKKRKSINLLPIALRLISYITLAGLCIVVIIVLYQNLVDHSRPFRPDTSNKILTSHESEEARLSRIKTTKDVDVRPPL